MILLELYTDILFSVFVLLWLGPGTYFHNTMIILSDEQDWQQQNQKQQTKRESRITVKTTYCHSI